MDRRGRAREPAPADGREERRRSIAPMAFPEPAKGVLRLGAPMINWYLVAEDDGVVLVDAGAPPPRSRSNGAWGTGRTLDDVRAVILTHADADHKGFAERLRLERGVPVHVHAADEELAASGKKDREGSIAALPCATRPPEAVRRVAAGGLPKNVSEVSTFDGGVVLDLPGPRA